MPPGWRPPAPLPAQLLGWGLLGWPSWGDAARRPRSSQEEGKPGPLRSQIPACPRPGRRPPHGLSVDAPGREPRTPFAMSCLDVMYQVYGPAQPYFAAAYSPYHQKLAFYSKMQEAAESSSSSFASPAAAASIKEEEECSPEKERPPEAEYINARCVLFTYFQGDISAVVDEHFSRALSQPSSYSPSSSGSSSSGSAKAARSASAWRDGSFPMSQRSFPPSFWNSTYQPSSVPASLGSPLAATGHTELPFATADPYSPGSLHSHLHQGGPEPWHPAHHHHHHHHHHHPYIGTQSSSYPRPTTVHEVYSPHFDPRYGSLLVPAASVRPHRLTPASVPTSVSPQCELGKNEPATSAWTTPAPFPSPAGEVAQSLGLNVDAARRYSFCGGSLLS